MDSEKIASPATAIAVSCLAEHVRKSLMLKIPHAPFIEPGEIKLYSCGRQFPKVQVHFVRRLYACCQGTKVIKSPIEMGSL